MKRLLLATAAGAAALSLSPAHAATITGWNTGNVIVAPTPDDGVTGTSIVLNGPASAAASRETGRIAFTPPEALSPGVKVEPQVYTQGGPDGITLDGCLMTSNPGATCTSPFQSGKRIKQQMTTFDPVDLVFDVTGTEDANYQVFHRLINLTGASADGFVMELGFGVGDSFTRAGDDAGLAFNPGFRAQPSGSGSVSTQFPFGLFGDATDNPNFSLDGFFAPERTGLTVAATATSITSTGFFGPYEGLFGSWLSRDLVPLGAFWDNDNDPGTDALLMAWLNPLGLWEMRREVLDLTNGIAGSLTDPLLFDDFDALLAAIGLGDALSKGAIEDLANLNVNFALALGDLRGAQSFTLRTTLLASDVAPVPLPAGAPLLLAALGGFALLRRRRQTAAA